MRFGIAHSYVRKCLAYKGKKMALIKIGCTLPHGLVLSVNGNNVTLNGQNQYSHMTNRLGTHGVTDVEQSFWDAWKKENRETLALKNGFIFEAKTEAEVEAKRKDTGKTGFEQIDPDSHSVETYDGK